METRAAKPDARTGAAIAILRFNVLVLGVVCLLACAQRASAQTPPPLSDIVRMVDGSFVRGTIVERDAEGNVTILVSSGDTRVVEAARIRYAGPSASDTSAATGATPSPGRSDASPPNTTVDAADRGGVAAVTFASPSQGPLHVHVVTGVARQRVTTTQGVGVISVAQYGASCRIPCALQLAPGSHQLALSFDTRAPVIVSEWVDVDRPLYLTANYENRRARHRRGLGIGIALMTAGVGVGLASIPVAQHSTVCDFGSTCRDPGRAWPTLTAGSFLFVGGLIGIILGATSHDRATIEPLTLRF